MEIAKYAFAARDAFALAFGRFPRKAEDQYAKTKRGPHSIMSRISCANQSRAGLIWQPRDPHAEPNTMPQWELTAEMLATLTTAGKAPALDKGALHVRLFETGRKRAGDDGLPSLALAHAKLPEAWPTGEGDQRKALVALCGAVETKLVLAEDASDLLILGGGDADKVRALYFRGKPAARKAITAIAQKLSTPESKSARLYIALGRHPDIVELWVIDSAGDQAKEMSELANCLLDQLLTANRPVAAWRTHYFMPVTAPASALAEGWSPAPEPEDVERNYFLEAANRVIGKGEGALESWQFQDAGLALSQKQLIVTNPIYQSEELKADLTALRFHRFGKDGQTALLEWEVCYESDYPKKPALWQRYLDEAGGGWTLARLLDFHAQARFIKHHYQRETSVKLGDKVMNHESKLTMLDLLRTIAPLPRAAPVENGRDRAFAFSSVILDGGPEKEGALDPLQASLACVDDYAPFGFYDNEFARDEYRASQYRRFWSWGTRYFATSHSFAMLGFRQDHDSIERGGKGFSEDKVHGLHMPQMYRRMFLLCLFQQLALDDVGGALSKHADWSRKEEDLRLLRRQWIDLRAARWFTRVSTELQGEELYAHMRKAQQIDDDAEFLNRKLADLEGIYELAKEKASKRRTQLLELVGLPFAIFIVIREILYTGLDEYPEAPARLFESLMECAHLQNPFYALMAVSLSIVFVVRVVMGWKESWSPFPSKGKNRYWRLFGLFVFAGLAALFFGLARSQPKFESDAVKHGQMTVPGAPGH